MTEFNSLAALPCRVTQPITPDNQFSRFPLRALITLIRVIAWGCLPPLWAQKRSIRVFSTSQRLVG